MKKKEHLYTRESYNNAGLQPFLEHTVQYLHGQRTIPVSKTSAEHNEHNVLFTFSDPLMTKFLERPDSLKKPYEVALKYGFGGYSAGGRNGIFYVRKNDDGLLKSMPALVKTHAKAIQDDLDIAKDGLDALKNVKIVYHHPSGERVVGVYNERRHRILFLDFARY